jgi:LCP family protein required for cell wall assembly
VGRHRGTRPDRVGRALRRALVATLAPGVVLVAAGLAFLRLARGRALDLALDPVALIWTVVVIGVLWALWIALIWRTYTWNRLVPAPRGLRLAAGACVFLMCVAVTAPMAVGARYAVAQRDLISSVFGDERSATAPTEVTRGDPWGHRSRVNVLLLGGDGAVHRPGVRTDSVILASIDTRTGSTVLFSLPRNLRDVPFPAGSKLAALYPDGFSGGGSEAEWFLNAVYRNVPALHPGILGRSDNEGADAVKLAVSAALGVPVDYYVLVNLGGFRQLVEAIGGITVNVNEPVAIGGNTDAGIPPDSYLQPGPHQRLDGYQALWFTRGRYGSSDYQRMQRQRCALNAIVAEADPVTLVRRYTRLASTAKQIVRTDIPQKLLHAFVDLAGKVKGEPMRSVGFERSAAFDPNRPDYGYVHATVRAALAPARRPAGAATGGATTGTTTGATAGPTPGQQDGGRGAAAPSRASDTGKDCAYHPAAQESAVASGSVSPP